MCSEIENTTFARVNILRCKHRTEMNGVDGFVGTTVTKKG